MITARKAAVIIASLRSDRLSVTIGAMPPQDFATAFDKGVESGVAMPDDLVAFRSALRNSQG